jgi:class 3 adenylate cyclase
MAGELIVEVGRLTHRIHSLGEHIGFGVGLSCGYSTIGMVGFEGRYDYAASGTHVNLASRLCDLAGDGEILASKKVALHEENKKFFSFADSFSIKGFTRPVDVYKLV